jgi:hypothetical protein
VAVATLMAGAVKQAVVVVVALVVIMEQVALEL